MSFKQDLAMERSRSSVKYFYEWLGYTWGNHIGEWMEMYGDRKGAEVHRVCIIAPRGHSKSTTLRVKLLHQCLFDKWNNNRPFTCWLISASKDTAIRRLQEIRDDMKRHPQLSRYLDPKKGNKTEIHFTNGAWIMATSVGSAIRGEHPACVAFDDVLVDSDDMSPRTLQQWFRKAITPMLDPKSSIYVVGTPMSMTDLYHTEMLDNSTWKTGTWGAIKNYDEWKSSAEEIKPIPLWPEHRSINYLMEQKAAIGDLEFAQEFLCRVVDDDAAVYPNNLIRKGLDMDTILQNDKLPNNRYVLGFDPSQGLGQDYTVIIILRQDEQGFVHFVNMWRRNDFPPDKQADVLIEMAKRYSAPVAAEDVGFQQLYDALIQQKGAMVDYRPSKVSNRVLKQGLLNRLRVWFEREMIIFPYGNDETRRLVEILLDELKTHAWRDGIIVDLGRHNDTVMAFAHAIDQFTYRTPDMPVVMKTMSGGEWMGGTKQGLPRDRTTSIGGRVINRRGF
jgi:hypothetical protein